MVAAALHNDPGAEAFETISLVLWRGNMELEVGRELYLPGRGKLLLLLLCLIIMRGEELEFCVDCLFSLAPRFELCAKTSDRLY